jgi:transposase
VHKSSVRLAAVRADELLDERTLPYDHGAVERAVSRWPGARVCYEAGPTGFGLYRGLAERGIACEVAAPGLVPTRPGERVKTDPRDARKLARPHAGGLLEPIFVPSRELEAARDLVRARGDARLDRMRARQRLSKLLLRHERMLPTKCWGVTRRAWLAQQAFDLPAQQHAFDDYFGARDLVDRRIEALEREVRQAAERGPWAELVARLRCLRGIDTLAALGIVCEVGDFARFATAEEFMGFTGLVPSERSSGERRKQGSITKSGNAHLRRCWSRPPGTLAAGSRSATSWPAASAASTPQSSSAPGAASSASTSAGGGWSPAASPTGRSSSPAPTNSPGSSGRSPPTSRSGKEAEPEQRPAVSSSG